MKGGRVWLRTKVPGDSVDPETRIDMTFPVSPPDWDINNETSRTALIRYQNALLLGIKAGWKKPINMSKSAVVTQEKDETPM